MSARTSREPAGRPTPALAEAARVAAAAPEESGLQVLAPVFPAITAPLHTPAARTFVFLATLGTTLTADAAGARCHGLPPAWVACLAPPAAAPNPAARTGAHRGAAVNVTFRAFGAFVKAVATPLAVPAVDGQGGVQA